MPLKWKLIERASKEVIPMRKHVLDTKHTGNVYIRKNIHFIHRSDDDIELDRNAKPPFFILNL